MHAVAGPPAAARPAVLYNPRRNRLTGAGALMNVTDYLVIAAVVISAVVGAMRGFLREAVALARVDHRAVRCVAFLRSDRAAPGRPARRLVRRTMGGAGHHRRADPAARALASARVLGHFVRLSIFSGMDRFLGLVFGLLRGVVLLGVFVILGQVLRLDGERWWRRRC